MLHILLNHHFTAHFLTRFDSSHPTSLGRGAALYMTTSTEPLLVAKVCNKWRASGHLLPFLGAKQQSLNVLDFKCLVRKGKMFLEFNHWILNVGEESFRTYWMRPNARSKAKMCKMPQFTLLPDSSTHSMPVSNSTARPKCLTRAYCCAVGKIIGFYLLILA